MCQLYDFLISQLKIKKISNASISLKSSRFISPFSKLSNGYGRRDYIYEMSDSDYLVPILNKVFRILQ
jgi:hypothetical protein